MKIILRLRLGAEEILLHWRQEVGELRVELSIEEKGRWVDLMLQLDGVPYRLTPPSAAETSGINGVERTLANLRSIRDELAEEVFDITGFVDFLTIEN